MDRMKTQLEGFTMRFAEGTAEDAQLVSGYVHKLGEYQKMSAKVTVTPERMRTLLAEKREEAIIGEYHGQPVAAAVIYEFASSYSGHRCMFLDAFYVDEAMRKKGIGTIMMQFLAKLTLDRGCMRLDWLCLDWNALGREFYHEFGANEIDNMNTFRLLGEALEKTAAGERG